MGKRIKKLHINISPYQISAHPIPHILFPISYFLFPISLYIFSIYSIIRLRIAASGRRP
jgi:hypothetical protein